jgi:hypothetical protein
MGDGGGWRSAAQDRRRRSTLGPLVALGASWSSWGGARSAASGGPVFGHGAPRLMLVVGLRRPPLLLVGGGPVVAVRARRGPLCGRLTAVAVTP